MVWQPELKKAGAVKAVVGVMSMHEEALELQVPPARPAHGLEPVPPKAS